MCREVLPLSRGDVVVTQYKEPLIHDTLAPILDGDKQEVRIYGGLLPQIHRLSYLLFVLQEQGVKCPEKVRGKRPRCCRAEHPRTLNC